MKALIFASLVYFSLISLSFANSYAERIEKECQAESQHEFQVCIKNKLKN